MISPSGERLTLKQFLTGAFLDDRISVIENRQLRRIDAEFYLPRYERNAQFVNMFGKTRTLGQLTNKFSKGIFDIKASEYTSKGIPFVRISNLKDCLISDDNIAYITPARHKLEKKTALKKYDLVLSKTAIPAASLVQIEVCNVSQDTIAVSTKESENFNFYLAIYLNTQFGLTQMERHFQGNIQQHLSLTDARTIRIPIPPEDFQREIRLIFEKSISNKDLSKKLYSEAEGLLLGALGLDGVDLSPQLSYTAMFNEVETALRLDPEYFQPKYHDLIEAINRTGQGIVLGDWVERRIRRGKLPDYVEDGDIPVINSKHVGKTHVEFEDNRMTTSAFVTDPRNRHGLIKKFDVLLNSTGYITIGRCQVVLDDIPAFVDGHVSVIRPKAGLDPVYLSLFLNALPGQLQTEQGWTGSSGQIELRPETISNYIIWKAPDEIQLKIRTLIIDAHEARLEAKQLLETAKQRVEQMILRED